MSKKGKSANPPSIAPPLADDEITIRPRWDRALRELWVGPILVKRFTGPATSQELIFQCYEEQEWRRELFDPLPPRPDLVQRVRLHKTNERLNKHQLTPLLRFRSAHEGTAFVWQWAVSAAELRALLAVTGNSSLLTADA